MPAPKTPVTLQDWQALARSRYTDVDSARAKLDASDSPRQRLTRAQTMLSVARSPQGRFGLTERDVSPAVVALLVATVEDLREDVYAPIRELARLFRKLAAEGHARDTIWTILEQDHGARELGFCYGDSAALLSF